MKSSSSCLLPLASCLTSTRSLPLPTFPQSSRSSSPLTVSLPAATVKQICTYRVILTDKLVSDDIQSLRPVFERPISHDELNEWLSPWYDLGYTLVDVMSWEWKVQNPATGEYEVVWRCDDS